MEIALRIGALVLGILGVVFYYRSIVRVMLLNRRERDPVERYARFVAVGITHLLAGGLHDQIYNKLTEIGLQVRPDRQACCEMFITLRAEYEASIRHIARATLMPIEEPWILPHPLAPTTPPAPS